MVLKAGAFFLIPLYTRALSLSEYGILELLYSISAVVGGVLGGGLAHATLRFYYEYDDNKDRNAVVTTSLLSAAIIITPILTVSSLANGLVSQWVFHSERYSTALDLVYVAVILEIIRQIGLSYLRAREYSISYVVVCVGQMAAQVICNVYTVVYLKLGITGILAGNCISIGLGVLALVLVILKECGFAYHFEKLKEMIKYSYPFAGSSFSSVFCGNADRFLLKTFLTFEAVGIYGIAQKFGVLLSDGLLEPFQKSFGAYRFAIMKRTDASGVQADILRYYLVFSGIVGSVIAFFSEEVLVMFTHQSYWSASHYAPILVVAAIAFGSGYVFQTGMLYTKKTHHLFFTNLCVDLAGLVIAWLFIRRWGLLGACLAFFAKTMLSAWLSLLVSQKLYVVRYDYPRVLRLAFLILIVFAVSYVMNQWSLGFALKLTLKLLITGIVVPLLVVLGLDSWEFGRVRAYVTQLARGAG
jgi:O-antigen/teichoic acid export membrane protein